jgi:hypothetical protein
MLHVVLHIQVVCVDHSGGLRGATTTKYGVQWRGDPRKCGRRI